MFLKEEKRAERRKSLMRLKTQAIDAVNQIKAARTSLTDLKSAVQADGDFGAAYVADVQSVIDEINVEVATL
jgi:hypothetical protein